MNFEFDPFKSKANLAKHGIDFVTAQKLWRDPDAIGGQADSTLERRDLLIAKNRRENLDGCICVARRKYPAYQCASRKRQRKKAYEKQKDEDNGGGI